MSKCIYCNTDPDLLQGSVIIEHEYGECNADLFIIGQIGGQYYFQLNISDTDDVDSNSVKINFCSMCGRDFRKEAKDE